jgi:hypothetical protein
MGTKIINKSENNKKKLTDLHILMQEEKAFHP